MPAGLLGSVSPVNRHFPGVDNRGRMLGQGAGVGTAADRSDDGGGTMPYVFIDHTGDVAVRVEARSLEALFVEAALALAATMVETADVLPRRQLAVVLEAGTPELLLVDWLNELVFRFDVDAFVPADADVRLAEGGQGWRLEATVRGEPFDPARHRVRVLVKSVTYHRLGIVTSAGGVETQIVFDI